MCEISYIYFFCVLFPVQYTMQILCVPQLIISSKTFLRIIGIFLEQNGLRDCISLVGRFAVPMIPDLEKLR